MVEEMSHKQERLSVCWLLAENMANLSTYELCRVFCSLLTSNIGFSRDKETMGSPVCATSASEFDVPIGFEVLSYLRDHPHGPLTPGQTGLGFFFFDVCFPLLPVPGGRGRGFC